MQQYRTGEQADSIPLRAERFYKLGDDWYFLVRGGTQFGPYRSRAEADQAVRQFFRPADAQQSSARKGGGVVHPFGSQRARRWRNSYKF